MMTLRDVMSAVARALLAVNIQRRSFTLEISSL
jgi:hypothetical protein